jgi:hypothetical protein
MPEWQDVNNHQHDNIDDYPVWGNNQQMQYMDHPIGSLLSVQHHHQQNAHDVAADVISQNIYN